MHTVIASIVVAAFVLQGGTGISARQKTEFIDLLQRLPTKGEFYTETSITKAQPYLPVLLSLTEADVGEGDLYPYLAVSRGLCDRPASRMYVVSHFDQIRHSVLKLFWAAMLFDADATST